MVAAANTVLASCHNSFTVVQEMNVEQVAITALRPHESLDPSDYCQFGRGLDLVKLVGQA